MSNEEARTPDTKGGSGGDALEALERFLDHVPPEARFDARATLSAMLSGRQPMAPEPEDDDVRAEHAIDAIVGEVGETYGWAPENESDRIKLNELRRIIRKHLSATPQAPAREGE